MDDKNGDVLFIKWLAIGLQVTSRASLGCKEKIYINKKIYFDATFLVTPLNRCEYIKVFLHSPQLFHKR